MADIDERNERLEQYTEDASDVNTELQILRNKIKTIAENKGITIEYGIDTPETLLTKIDNATVVNIE